MTRLFLFIFVFGTTVALAGCPAEPGVPVDGGGGVDGPLRDTMGGSDAGSDCSTPDGDGDGVDSLACGGLDCDDTNRNRRPGATEICDAADLDEDCDPTTFGIRDADGDGEADAACCNDDVCGTDCDDTRAGVSPLLLETCDGLDNDCDTRTDEGVLGTFYRDADGDNHGSAATDAETMEACFAPTGFVSSNNDCDDGAAAVHPGTPELCDGGTPPVDEDCDGTADPSSLCACTAGTPSRVCPLPGRCMGGTQDCVGGRWTDCSIAPRVPELCDGEDDDCDGSVDEMLTVSCFADADNDGYPATGAAMSGECPDPTRVLVGECPRFFTNRLPMGADLDCDDTNVARSPGATDVCNDIDDDCMGGIDDPFPTLGTSCDGSDVDLCNEGVIACAGPAMVACNDMSGNSLDTCDRTDDDCDGRIDEGFPTLGTMCDGADGDMCAEGMVICGGPTMTICGDMTGTIPEMCNGTDDDCNGMADETFYCRRTTSVSCTTACGTATMSPCPSTCANPTTPATFGSCPHNCMGATCSTTTDSACNYCDDDASGSANDEITEAGPTTSTLSLSGPCAQLTTGGTVTCSTSLFIHDSSMDSSVGSARRTMPVSVPWGDITIEATADVFDLTSASEPQRGWAIWLASSAPASATVGTNTDLGAPHNGRGIALEWRYNGSAADSIHLVSFNAGVETTLDSMSSVSPNINGASSANRELPMRLVIHGEDRSTPAVEFRICAYAGMSFTSLGCITTSPVTFDVGNLIHVGLSAANGAGTTGRTYITFPMGSSAPSMVRAQACF